MDLATLARKAWIAERRGDLERAETLARRLLARDPDHSGGRHLLGLCHRKHGDLERATELLREAVESHPDYAIAHRDLGMVSLDRGRHRDAMPSLVRALELEPRDPASHVGLGIAFRHDRDLAQAERAFRNALRLDPSHLGAHFNLAITLLTLGRWREGFEHYEERLRIPRYPMRRLPVERPLFTNQPLEGQRLLLRAEQGLGDAVMAIRFARAFAARGARVRLQCHAALRRLLASAEGVEAIASDSEVPAYDLQLPLMSSMHRLGITPASLPAAPRYLAAPAARVRAWGERLHPERGFRVGLVWRSRPIARARFHLENRDKERRALSLEDLMPLLRMPGARFVSLQKEHEKEDEALMREHDVLDLSEELHDLAETAACLEHLDAVVSIDTAVAHLAGAVGTSTVAVLPHAGEWRWLTEREDSPWYPSLRLARCARGEGWPSAIARTRELVQEWRRGG